MGKGDRLRQTVDGVTTTVTLDLGAKLSQVLADGNATYLYGLDRIGALESDGWRYHHADALGSVRLVTDPAGQVVGQASYTPSVRRWWATPSQAPSASPASRLMPPA